MRHDMAPRDGTNRRAVDATPSRRSSGQAGRSDDRMRRVRSYTHAGESSPHAAFSAMGGNSAMAIA